MFFGSTVTWMTESLHGYKLKIAAGSQDHMAIHLSKLGDQRAVDQSASCDETTGC